ncbi:MAG: cytochrome ubiquinol oxidase subunit [Gammaproteobacteria bacterium]|jgi:cytochrome d ubiquinol oxidase subunit I|nr:cytochrome ubiquinol oxidase subunit [Gammaproteobacteria bacterium]
MLTTLLLSRIQFAFTISMHILFPAFSIGLATFLAIMEGLWLKTKNPLYLSICKFWMKIFALTFGMGVVSGIVMEFQFGTNWAGFAKQIGDVLGSLFVYEVLTAFFIEAGFLGVMIFGWNKVGPRLHYVATLLVAIGVTLSAFWIMSANSWMQHPTGFKIVNGAYIVTNWLQVVFNPLMIPRYIHMLLAAYVTTLFVIAGVAAYYLLKGLHVNFSKKCLSFAMACLIVLMPLQIMAGDTVGVKIHEYQPLKTAAMEAVWDTENGAPLLLFAWPDQADQKNLFAIGIPYGASLFNTHSLNGQLIGLKTVSPADQPYVPIVFFSFRLMVGAGLIMFAMALTGLFLRMRKQLYTSAWFLKACILSSPLGFVALWTGWITAEVGRQPWAVYNYIRTSDAVSAVSVNNVIISFALLFVVYGLIFGVFYFRYLWRILTHGPDVSDVNLTGNAPFQYLAGQISEKQ